MTCPPVLLIAFNRPLHARKVFERIRQARPSRLYIAVDGPRQDRPDDGAMISGTMTVFEDIDWACEVKKLVRSHNLGCRLAVSSAISWFFDQEEEGIILEDDCEPDPSFFAYCDHLLRLYKTDDSIMHINGVNFQDGILRGNGSSYYFSKICHVWGWATWRRAWKKYDNTLKGIEEFFEGGLYRNIINYKGSLEYWSRAFTLTKEGIIDTWDYQWVFSVWKNNGLSITPNANLISNIGFDEAATHTKKLNLSTANKPVSPLELPLKDSFIFVADGDADQYSFNKLFSNRSSFLHKVKRKLKLLAKSPEFSNTKK